MNNRFERFTEISRRALSYAQEEAEAVGSPSIDPIHLLMALVRTHSLGVKLDLEAIRSSLQRGEGSDSVMLSPRLKSVVGYAIDNARYCDETSIGTKHLLAGLVIEALLK